MGKDTSSGVIFDVQRFCVNDGVGIRTTIFLKGCPLKCKWCHNPESQKVKQELRYKAVRCVGSPSSGSPASDTSPGTGYCRF